MTKLGQVLLVLFIASASVLSFEIIATRISSVIFVNSYAFAILSFAILGLSLGAIYEYYFGKKETLTEKNESQIFAPVFYHGVSTLLFIFIVTKVPAVTSPFFFFILILFPFFFAGRFYSNIFKLYSAESFKIYSVDLIGASIGCLLPLILIPYMGPINGVLVVSFSLITILLASVYLTGSKIKTGLTLLFGLAIITLIGFFAPKNWLGEIPIGEFEEKDFYHVYEDPSIRSTIVDSKWSIFGRSDLVEHSNQDRVKHIFIDGAAGSQMYKFGGDVNNIDPYTSSLLLQYTTSIPFLLLEENQKNSMLVIGPGGGKEILTGLVSNIGSITGVEINKDFVDIVKEESGYNGGIYTDFPNVSLIVNEGREYAKSTSRTYDLIVMALPSTQQLQSIDSYALSENYLLTVEAIEDYLNILTPEGELIFTVHNNWEMNKLIITVLEAFENRGIVKSEALNHLLAVETTYSPTLVIKKSAFTEEYISRTIDFLVQLPPELPKVTFIPYTWDELSVTLGNSLLKSIKDERSSLEEIVSSKPYDIGAVYDDNPYFYNLSNGIPENFKNLLKLIIPVILLIILFPFIKARNKHKKEEGVYFGRSVLIFVGLGAGFMLIEVSLFQKLILYLGSPTISLSVLLCSILVGMGAGSMVSSYFMPNDHFKRLFYSSLIIVLIGSIAIMVYPLILESIMDKSRFFRSFITFILVFPLGLIMGVPFPTSIQIMKKLNFESFIPWMYGVNGSMSILGSIGSIIISMLLGFKYALFLGLLLYLLVAFFAWTGMRLKPQGS